MQMILTKQTTSTGVFFDIFNEILIFKRGFPYFFTLPVSMGYIPVSTNYGQNLDANSNSTQKSLLIKIMGLKSFTFRMTQTRSQNLSQELDQY